MVIKQGGGKQMNYLDFFKKNIYPEVNNIFGIVQTNLKEKGDFGFLIRFDFYSKDKIGNIDFWSQGIIDIDIFKIENLDLIHIYNKLLFPNEVNANELLNFKRTLLNE